MDTLTFERERRRQTALDRLGTDNPSCVICADNNWRHLELHHIAWHAFDDMTVIVCCKCHRDLSDMQKDHVS